MRRIHFADISIFLVNRIFNWRFWIAGLTKKSKIAKKVINKLLFEKDDVVIIPNTIPINQKIESETSDFLPTDVIKEVIKQCDDIVIIKSIIGFCIYTILNAIGPSAMSARFFYHHSS